MSKNKHFKNFRREEDNLKKDFHPVDEDKAQIYDDIEAINDGTSEDNIKNINVEDIENEEVEDVVDAKDETVLPEDNANDAKIKELEAALEKEKKEYLFLMADFDNFRKRVLKEKAELIKNASEKVLKGILPIVDDFERGLSATKDVEDAGAVREGMELIYNKLIKYLNENGVKAMESTDTNFDAELHDAIASVPTGDDSKKGKVIDTTQKGYTLNDKVLRHAKVVVGE